MKAKIPAHAVQTLLAAALLALLPAPATLAQSAQIGDVRLTVEPLPSGSGTTQHGYLEYRVHIDNRSQNQPRRVELRLPANAYLPGSDRISGLSRRLEVAPQTRTTVSLFQPPVPMEGSGLAARVGSRWEELPVNLGEHVERYGYFPSSGGSVHVLMSQEVDSNFRGEASSAVGGDLNVYQSETPIDGWSPHWLGYSRFDGVVISAAELNRAPLEVRNGLERYVRAGGSLVVIGEWSPPGAWGAVSNGESGAEGWDLGFGRLRTERRTVPRQISGSTYQSFYETWRRTANPWTSQRDVAEANRVFPVVDALTVPVTGLLVLTIVFAILIGPVNLIVLSRKRRRMWLLWTVPAISVVTCFAIWAYAIASEGLSGHERSAGVTVLDQRNLTAATIGWTAFYSPLTPGEGLRYDAQAELTPQIGRHSYRSGGRARTVNWTGGQHLASGWVAARVPAHFMYRSVQSTVRERVQFRAEADGTWKAVNGLGAAITELTFAAPDGRVYRAISLAAGAEATLSPQTSLPRLAGPQRQLREIYRDDWLRGVEDLSRRPEQYLAPGRYVALLEGAAPFVESGLPSAERKARSVVVGVTEHTP